jgi:hypothetical protein
MPSTLIQFTRLDLDTALKDRIPALSDSSSFAARRTNALKMALADQQDTYYASNDPYTLRDTLDLSPLLDVGTPKWTDATGAQYKIALPTDAQRVNGNAIFIIPASGLPLVVPRVTIDTIAFTGGSATTLGFYEAKGQIILYAATGQFTGTPKVHFMYQVNLAVPTVDSDPLDIWPQDFAKLLDAVASNIGNL